MLSSYVANRFGWLELEQLGVAAPRTCTLIIVRESLVVMASSKKHLH